jgi:hypothetical protein
MLPVPAAGKYPCNSHGIRVTPARRECRQVADTVTPLLQGPWRRDSVHPRHGRPAVMKDLLDHSYNVDVLGGSRVSDQAWQNSFYVAISASAHAALSCVTACPEDFRGDLAKISSRPGHPGRPGSRPALRGHRPKAARVAEERPVHRHRGRPDSDCSRTALYIPVPVGAGVSYRHPCLPCSPGQTSTVHHHGWPARRRPLTGNPVELDSAPEAGGGVSAARLHLP